MLRWSSIHVRVRSPRTFTWAAVAEGAREAGPGREAVVRDGGRQAW